MPVLVIASGNRHKVAEIGAMLAAVDLEVRQQPDGLEIEETGLTYAENARLKAEAVASLTGQWALADDSGLEVDALDGAPGIYSARYAPTDPERIARLLQDRAREFAVAETLDGGNPGYRSNRHFDILNESFVFQFTQAKVNNSFDIYNALEQRRNAYSGGTILLNLTSHDEIFPDDDPWNFVE